MTDPGPLPDDIIRDLRARLDVAERLVRVDAGLARRLSECITNNNGLAIVVLKLRRALTMVLSALEMVRDANRDEPHIPPTALATIEQAIKIVSEELDDQTTPR
jgi:hypothetical protein